MTADLPPDVRDRAAQAAFERSRAISPYSGWDELPEEWREIARGEVDAVAEVLAAEQPPAWDAAIQQCGPAVCDDRCAEGDTRCVLPNGHLCHRDDSGSSWPPVEVERDALKARVDLLTTALTALSSELLAAGYVAASELTERKWRAALSATPTEEAL